MQRRSKASCDWFFVFLTGSRNIAFFDQEQRKPLEIVEIAKCLIFSREREVDEYDDHVSVDIIAY